MSERSPKQEAKRLRAGVCEGIRICNYLLQWSDESFRQREKHSLVCFKEAFIKLDKETDDFVSNRNWDEDKDIKKACDLIVEALDRLDLACDELKQCNRTRDAKSLDTPIRIINNTKETLLLETQPDPKE